MNAELKHTSSMGSWWTGYGPLLPSFLFRYAWTEQCRHWGFQLESDPKIQEPPKPHLKLVVLQQWHFHVQNWIPCLCSQINRAVSVILPIGMKMCGEPSTPSFDIRQYSPLQGKTSTLMGRQVVKITSIYYRVWLGHLRPVARFGDPSFLSSCISLCDCVVKVLCSLFFQHSINLSKKIIIKDILHN